MAKIIIKKGLEKDLPNAIADGTVLQCIFNIKTNKKRKVVI